MYLWYTKRWGAQLPILLNSFSIPENELSLRTGGFSFFETLLNSLILE